MRFAPPLRTPRVIPTVLGALLIACGSTSETPPDTDGPSSLSVVAGDQQQAAAGAAVGVAPAVMVRNAGGAPLAGVAVQFTIVAGGGTLDGGTPTTDATGVARVTRWTLGAGGTQRIQARVGNLAPVTFEASIASGPAAIPVTLGSAGGTFQITTEGHPFRGLSLTIPAGTFAGGSSMTLQVVPDPAIPAMPPGYRVSGPVLAVSSVQLRGANLMTLDIPVTRGANEAVLIAFHDPVRRVTEVMPSVGRTATSVRVVTSHLRPDLLLGRALGGGVAGMMASSRNDPVGWLMPVTVTLPLQPVGPVMNTSTERWPVIDHGSARYPNGHGAAIASAVTLSKALQSAGSPLTELVKSLGTPGFYADAAPLAVLLRQQGRLSGTLTTLVQQYTAAIAAAPQEGPGGPHIDLVGGMALSPGPVMMALTPSAPGAEPLVVNGVAGSETEVTVLSPASTSSASLVRAGTAGYTPIALPRTPDQPLVTIDRAVPLPSFMVDFQPLIGDLQKMRAALAHAIGTVARSDANRQMATEAGMPWAQISVRAGPEFPWGEEVQHSLVARSEGTEIRLTSSSSVPADGVIVSTIAGGTDESSVTGTVFPLTNLDGYRNAMKSLGPLAAERQLAIAQFEAYFNFVRQVTTQPLTVFPARYRITPSELELPADRTADLAAVVPMPPPEGFRIIWDWGDESTTEQVGLLTASHTYEEGGDYRVISTLTSNTAAREVLGADTLEISSGAIPSWILTSIVDVDDLFGEYEGADTEVGALNRLLAAPGAGVIHEGTSLGKTYLSLLLKRSGVWDPAIFSDQMMGGGEDEFDLGVSPTETFGFGPFFNAFNMASYTKSTEDLNSGTISGQYPSGSQGWPILDAGTQTGPDYVAKITATRNGTLLTGTITFVNFGIDDDDSMLEASEIINFRFNFTAVRVK